MHATPDFHGLLHERINAMITTVHRNDIHLALHAQTSKQIDWITSITYKSDH